MSNKIQTDKKPEYYRPKANAELADVVIDGKNYKIYFGNIINPFNPRVSWKENEPWNCNGEDESWEVPKDIFEPLILEYFDLHFWSEVQINEPDVSFESAIFTYLSSFLKDSIPNWRTPEWRLKVHILIEKYKEYKSRGFNFEPGSQFNTKMGSQFNITKLIREKKYKIFK